MNIASAKNQIKDTVEAYLEKDDAGMYVIAPVHQRPVFLVGAPGIGKTAIMEQIAHELGIGIVSYSMTHHTRQSALGLPRIEHREFDGLEYEASEYTMSEIVASVYDYIKASGRRRGILFLDEINCVSETLYPSMLQFLQYKTFGKHKIPDDWVVVCAGNPAEYNRSVHEFDIVTLDRLRQIDVEPDYMVWKNYATAKGIHPAVTTFLDAKRDCFYKVESKAGGGKAFVTARGWEDLAQLVSLYEQMGKPVDRDLIAQYLRDDDIADQFSVYYALFNKYRADYQVGRILDGNPDADVYSRARAAQFDERIALVGLLLDSLAGECAKVLDVEGTVINARDVLREIKEPLAAGASIDDTLISRLGEREATLAKALSANTMSAANIRKERLAIGFMRELVSACTLAKTGQGTEAFKTLQDAYMREVAKIQPLVDAADAKMSNAFQFVADVFDSREMLVFLAEVTTRQATTQFISHYGNEAFYKYNDQLEVDASRTDLANRISELTQLADDGAFAATHSVTDGSVAGMTTSSQNAYGVTGAGSVPMKPVNEALAPDAVSTQTAGVGHSADAALERAHSKPSAAQLDAYYNDREVEWGFASMSKMIIDNVPMAGKKVLDVQCRRGKGVYKLSAKVGAAGTAIGVDSSKAYIQDAKESEPKALRRNGFSKSNMEFCVAYPEDLLAGGIGNCCVDVVYINNVMTLLCDQQAALDEFFRVLKPGGTLICETILSDKERDDEVVDAARKIGNSVQAGRTKAELFEMLARAGFAQPEVIDSYEVAADRGYVASEHVAVVDSAEDVVFSAVCINAVKPA